MFTFLRPLFCVTMGRSLAVKTDFLVSISSGEGLSASAMVGDDAVGDVAAKSSVDISQPATANPCCGQSVHEAMNQSIA